MRSIDWDWRRLLPFNWWSTCMQNPKDSHLQHWVRRWFRSYAELLLQCCLKLLGRKSKYRLFNQFLLHWRKFGWWTWCTSTWLRSWFQRWSWWRRWRWCLHSPKWCNIDSLYGCRLCYPIHWKSFHSNLISRNCRQQNMLPCLRRRWRNQQLLRAHLCMLRNWSQRRYPCLRPSRRYMHYRVWSLFLCWSQCQLVVRSRDRWRTIFLWIDYYWWPY